MSKYANAEWHGTGKDGNGKISTETKFLNDVPFTYATRFGEAKDGTNPEELIAAAHAGCFSMKLSFVLNAAGFTADTIETKCDITLGDGAITKSHLTVKAKIPGISKEKFDECAKDAKENCPISKSLNSNIEISMEATLS
ncbi:OsmC family protein [Ginsengibacter hankyongi]|uniref:OsmC family protein n=1 Tax=Ginsengibacter hankyongi TaxID=2607284 RepID=A0A5J5IH59_9BACT|nr:OsmC family protein [Ginsengibacter hankyongi]KAA9039525.1 OsmC family protein [Ginsengibacter hankyongi]